MLCWILEDARRADRLLALTGLTPDDLRAGLDDSGVLSAVLDFVAGHEPDLLEAAQKLGFSPRQLVDAARNLAS